MIYHHTGLTLPDTINTHTFVRNFKSLKSRIVRNFKY